MLLLMEKTQYFPFLWLPCDHLENCLNCPNFPACWTHSNDLTGAAKGLIELLQRFFPTYPESVPQVCASSQECVFVGWTVLVWGFICLMQIITAPSTATVPVKRGRHCLKGSLGLKFRRISFAAGWPEEDNLCIYTFTSWIPLQSCIRDEYKYMSET